MKKQKIRVHYIKEEFEITNTEQLLTLMGLYLSEWEHRDALFWKLIFTYFFASLIVMLLPFIDMWGLHLPSGIPSCIFPATGMIMAIVFFLVSNGYIVRLRTLSEPYKKLIDKLPPSYRRKSVKELYPGVWGSVLNWRMTFVICLFMFVSLVVIGLILLYFTLA